MHQSGMDQDIFKAPKAKKRIVPVQKASHEMWDPKRRRRTKEDFMSFCSIVLEYTKYEAMRNEDARVLQSVQLRNLSPLDSAGASPRDSCASESPGNSPPDTRETSPSQPSPFMSPPQPPTYYSKFDMKSPVHVKEQFSPNSNNSSPRSGTDLESDEDSHELITCFCLKPFAGRPMIECNECLTWIHLSCAKIRKNNIPEEYVCQKCKDSKLTTRKSARQRIEKHNMDA